MAIARRGHTDNVPIHTQRFHRTRVVGRAPRCARWSLSVSVRRILVGPGDTRPWRATPPSTAACRTGASVISSAGPRHSSAPQRSPPRCGLRVAGLRAHDGVVDAHETSRARRKPARRHSGCLGRPLTASMGTCSR
jgi:hypothetical protein